MSGVSQTFVLRLGLGPVPARLDDVLGEIGDRLDPYEPQLSQQKGELELSLTVAAGDVWLAVLLAMAAVTGLGYPVIQLDARPVSRGRSRPAARTAPK